MKRIELSLGNLRIKTKELDAGLADYIEQSLQDGGINLRTDNATEKFFIAYLKLASKCRNMSLEIDKMADSLEEIEN